ncbi:MAG: hypothetical protein ACE5JX_16525 [Acidobacteriota bacterium]
MGAHRRTRLSGRRHGPEPDTGTIFFRDQEGKLFPISVGGVEKSSIFYSLAPGGALRLVSDGAGPARAGYAIVTSTSPFSAIAGNITYNLSGFEVSVPSSPMSQQFHVYVERSSTSDSGIAIANPSEQDLEITLELLDAGGAVQEETTLTLPARQQQALFISQIFGAVPGEFIGSVRATAEENFSLVALRQKSSGSLAIVSARATDEPVSSVILAQLADGGGIRSEIVLLNSGDRQDTGTLSFRDSLGQSLALSIGSVKRTNVPFSLPAGGVLRIMTDGTDPTAHDGYAQVTSDLTDSQLSASMIFSLAGFEVSVPGSPLTRKAHFFVEFNSSAHTGLAVANPGKNTLTVAALLLDQEGKSSGSASISVPAGQHTARFAEQIFPPGTIPDDFIGTMQLESDDDFAVLGLRQRPNLSLTTLSGSNEALSAPVVATDPGGYWLGTDLPQITSDQKLSYCTMSSQELSAFKQDQLDRARKISDDLESYIRAWLRGEVPPELPEDLLPPTINSSKTHSWKLLRPEEVRAEDQWYFFPARREPSEDHFQGELYQANAATHVTYLKALFIAPLDAQLLVEGDFPHARQMSFHIMEPIDPDFPVTTQMGVMEVPLIDVDIVPDPGHVNPFVVGANRNATNRHYHVRFDLKEGNAVELNPVLQDKHFRAPGDATETDLWNRNVRVGGPLVATGPWAGGVIMPSLLWLRYYVPDLNPDGSVDPLAGVPLPKLLLRLDTGETFWLQCDFSLGASRQLTTAPRVVTLPMEPTPLVGPSLGWFKMYSILLTNSEGRAYQIVEPFTSAPAEPVKEALRNQMACFFNQGSDRPVPGSIGHSTTDHAYHSYLTRPFFLGPRGVIAITGRLPTTPRTRHGEPTMEAAQARYWSICHSANGPSEPIPFRQLVYGCLIDEDIVTDENMDYIIVWTRGTERPSNAKPECGVTWQDFGTDATQGAPIRWMSVFPDHYMEEFTPSDENIPWGKGSWSDAAYDQSLVGRNTPGVMGPYHPVVHYWKTTEEFEALGCPIDPRSLPEWALD